jgi:hypothetical protein
VAVTPTIERPREASVSASAGTIARQAFPSLQRKLGLTLLATLVLSALVLGHVSGMNGPWYWKWAWKGVGPTRIYPLSALAALPLFSALLLYQRRTIGVAWTVGAMMLTCFLLQLTILGAESDPFSLAKIAHVTASPGAAGYFIAAERLMPVPDWLARYPELMPTLPFHAATKPPGIVLYNMSIIRLFGASQQAAMVAGTVIGILATLAVPAMFWLSRATGAHPTAALHGAALMAICPSLTNCLPEFDQLYPVVTCALVGLWISALQRDRLSSSAAFGLVLASALFFAYNLLVLGFFLAGLAVYFMVRRPRMPGRTIARHVGAALGALVCWYLLVWLVFGFNPLASFQSALSNQARLLNEIARPYPATVLFDITDFAMGIAWIPLLWMGFDIVASRRRADTFATVVAALSAAQLLVVAASGLLPGETFRVWMFLLPLVAHPAACEIGRWPFGSRMVALGCVWFLTTVIGQNMVFIA